MSTTAIVLTIIASIIKLLVSCLPTDAVNWILRKFDLHFEISHADTSLTMDGIPLEGEEKLQVINHFNEAKFLKKNIYSLEMSNYFCIQKVVKLHSSLTQNKEKERFGYMSSYIMTASMLSNNTKRN